MQSEALSEGDMRHQVSLAEANVLVRDFQAGYGADPWFAVAGNIAVLQLRGGLYFRQDGAVCVLDCGDLRKCIIREAHELPYLVTLGMLLGDRKGLLAGAHGI